MDVNTTDKKRNDIIKTLIVLFLISIVYILYSKYSSSTTTPKVNKQNNVPEYFDYGTIADSIYCNTFFKFKIPIPKQHVGSYKTYNLVPKSLTSYDTVPLTLQTPTTIGATSLLLIEKEIIKITPNDIILLMREGKHSIVSEHIKNIGSFNAPKQNYQLHINVQNLDDDDFKGNLNKYLSMFSNMNSNYQQPTKIISGIPFKAYSGTQRDRLPGVYQNNTPFISYITEINGFALNIDLFYNSDEEKDFLLNLVDTIEFF